MNIKKGDVIFLSTDSCIFTGIVAALPDKGIECESYLIKPENEFVKKYGIDALNIMPEFIVNILSVNLKHLNIEL